MSLGRWLLVHSLSICILVMFIIGYAFKDELKLSQAYSQLLNLDSKPLATNNVDQSQADSLTNDSTKSKVTTIKRDELAVNSTTLSKQDNSKSINSDYGKPRKNSEESTFENLNTIAKSQNLSAENLAISEFEKNVYKARQAYNNKNFKYAIQLYQNEIKLRPKNPDLYGELGNIYYGLNNYDVASDYYLEAGRLFIEMNNQHRAKNVYNILLSMNVQKANYLLSLNELKYQ